jgi:hypothetical protein
MTYERSAVEARGFGKRLPQCGCVGPVEIVAVELSDCTRHFRFRCCECCCIAEPSLAREMVKPETMAAAPVVFSKPRAGMAEEQKAIAVTAFPMLQRVPIERLEGWIDRVRIAQDSDAGYEAEQAIVDDAIVLDIDPDHVLLLKADPHKWGQGLIHQIDPERDQTLCGKSPGGCPGAHFWGPQYQITCKACLRSLEARAQAEERRQIYAEQDRDYQRQREEEERRWWDAYDAYLAGPEWQARRAKVLRRANGICEGCGERPAVQVHHLRYPKGCFAGSPQWAAQEMLFDLRAICERCHTGVHQR